ncbi:hypothetical protein SK128_010763 [Halocaridina rubra]|uniref:F5/8 type C domain-containing protein n=1 Tax=Halocaridina rubra TaxID=373956 RepID=A0AAN8XK32_HALRR
MTNISEDVKVSFEMCPFQNGSSIIKLSMNERYLALGIYALQNARMLKTVSIIISVMGSEVGGQAIDGDLSTYYHSRSGEMFPWWIVDLGEAREIYKITILPRPGYFSFRFQDVERWRKTGNCA